ncbi:hypothetical protein FQR65_LT00915 [Abscondita terminalis]|nr:hypothetical protein FQR65_LT00915 [Abscondita terminalis]
MNSVFEYCFSLAPTMSPKQVALPKHLQKLIDKIIAERGIENKIIDIKPFVNPGDNWLGNILKIKIVGNNIQNNHVSVSFIVKLAPTVQIQRQCFPISALYEREIYMYNFVIPELIKLQKENNVKNIFAPFAKCYGTISKEGEETVLLENMQPLGYDTVNHRHPVSYHHASLAMKYYGKLHAMSFALQAQKPELYEEIRTNIIISTGVGQTIHKLTERMGLKVLNYIEKEVEIYKAFMLFLKNPSFVFKELVTKKLERPYGVVLQMDSQLRNILFKHEASDASVPKDLCFIDWQASVLSNPCIDIGSFLWISTDKQLRDNYYFDLIDTYYTSFSSFLNEFGEDSEKMYPRAVFEKHLQKYSSFGLLASIWSLAINLLKPEDVPNVADAVNSEVLLELISDRTGDEYFTRIRNNIVDFINYGYILNENDFYTIN